MNLKSIELIQSKEYKELLGNRHVRLFQMVKYKFIWSTRWRRKSKRMGQKKYVKKH